MNKLVILSLAACAGLAALVVGAAENKPAPAAKPETSAAAPAKGPRIVVEPASHDFGKALQQKTLTKEFSIRNSGTEDLVLEEPTTSCGCTVAALKIKTLKPGASTPLVVTLRTGAYSGDMQRLIYVRSNDPVKPSVDVKLSVQVVDEKAPAAAAPAAAKP